MDSVLIISVRFESRAAPSPVCSVAERTVLSRIEIYCSPDCEEH